MSDPVKILYAGNYKNTCLFYSVLSCISKKFNDLSTLEKNNTSVFLRDEILKMIKITQNNISPLVTKENIKQEIRNLSINNFAEETSIFFLCKFFNINILVWARNIYGDYGRFFSCRGTDKYDNNESFIIIYNDNNIHFQPVEIMGETIFKKTLLLNIRDEGLLFEPLNNDDTDKFINNINDISEKQLRNYIKLGYNRSVIINRDLLIKMSSLIKDILK